MEITIRRAEKEDYRACAGIVQTVHDMHSKARPDIYKAAVRALEKEEFLKWLENPCICVWVAEVPQKSSGKGQAEAVGAKRELAGLCQMEIQELPETKLTYARRRAHIAILCVKEKFRKVGIGRKLIEQAEEETKRQGIPLLELQVWEFNQEAVECYEKLGMKCRNRNMEKSLLFSQGRNIFQGNERGKREE